MDNLVALVKRFEVVHGCKPERIELHPVDTEALLSEFAAAETYSSEHESLETPSPANDGFFCYFLGIRTFRRDDVPQGEPRLVLL
jgi:hypothetical protein